MKMKSCVWLVCVLLCMPMVMEGQVIRVDGGVAFSTIRTKGEALGDGVRPFQMSVGMEYCDKGLFNLTSSIGYLRKGMKSPILIQENVGDLPIATRSYMDYLTVNTLFNMKGSIRRETYYVGVGPRLDFNMGNHTVADGPVDDLDLIGMKGGQAVVFGLKCEAGFWYDLNEHYRVGANFAYLPSFTNTWGGLKDRTFTVGLSLGYRL